MMRLAGRGITHPVYSAVSQRCFHTYIVDDSFKTLLSISPSFDTAFDGLQTYVNECCAIIHDLKQYSIDLMEEDTAGCKLLSHIILSKLLTSVKRES